MSQRTDARQQTNSQNAASSARRSTIYDIGINVAALLVLAIVVGAVYWTAIDGPFIYDDSNSIQFNQSIVRLFPLVGDNTARGPLNPPPEISTSGRPLVNLSLALNYHFGQFQTRGYHVTNVALHVAAAFLLWGLVRRTLRLPHFEGRFTAAADPLALCVAMLWAVHPLQTDAVEYVTQRTEVMMGLCYLATLYASLRYWTAPYSSARITWMILAAAACMAGMACKEVMVSAPIVILLFERTFVARSFRRALENSWPLYVGLSLGWLVLAWLNIGAPRSLTAGFHLETPAYAWWFTQAKVLSMYARLIIWPWPLVIHYEMPLLDTWQAAWPWLVATCLAAIGVLALVYKNLASGFLLASMFAILAPTLIVPITTEVAAERRMYLPLAAAAALFVVGAYSVASRVQRHMAGGKLIAGASGFPILVTSLMAMTLALEYAAISIQRLEVYRNEVTLWRDTLLHQPDSPLVRMNLGMALIKAGQPNQALEHYEAAIRLEPKNGATHHNNLAYALLSAGRSTDAIAEYEEALRIDPNLVEAHISLALLLLQDRQLDQAIEHYQDALRIRPSQVEAYFGLASAHFQAGRNEEALAVLKRLLEHLPKSSLAYAQIAILQRELGQPAEAIAAAERAVGLARAQGDNGAVQRLEAWLNSYRATLPAP